MGCAIQKKEIIPVIPKSERKLMKEEDPSCQPQAKLNEDEATTEILTKNKEKNDRDINEKHENNENNEKNIEKEEKNVGNHEKEEKKTTASIKRKNKKEEGRVVMTTIIRGSKPPKHEIKKKVSKALDLEIKEA